jgi:hypothetical protein
MVGSSVALEQIPSEKKVRTVIIKTDALWFHAEARKLAMKLTKVRRGRLGMAGMPE